ncbi:MAG: MXAN_2562 family outer membrane beta-barrel protein, partial [Polyangiales bacterium]
ALVLAAATEARAQDLVESRFATETTVIESPEYVVWELFRLGPYTPKEPSEFDGFSGDRGPMLTTEVDFIIWRIPYVGPIAAGARFGWARYKGPAVDASGMNTGEKTKLNIFPFSALAVLRIDVLARELDVPILLTGKVGLDVIPWKSKTGGSSVDPFGDDAVSLGLVWGGQVALELDFLEPRAARRLDEDWGINHSFLFFELFGSTAGAASGDTLDLSEKLTFAMGLGFVM